MLTSLLFTVAALATPAATDSAFSGFHTPDNPSQGDLGTWAYGYFEPGDTFTLLPNLVPNTAHKLDQWQIQTTVTGGMPRITRNYGTTDKTYSSTLYPATNYLVLKPKNTNAVVVRFTADAAGDYTFDTTFKAMRTVNASSTLVSIEHAGVTVGGCSGSVNGLLNGVGTELVCSAATIALTAGQSVDFIVDANGATAAYDDIGLKVDVTMIPELDTDTDGLFDSVEATLGTDPNDSDSDDDTLLDGEEVDTYGTDPLLADTDSDGLSDADEIHLTGTDPTLADTDADGMSDFLEQTVGTDPLDADSDDDGLSDGDEVLGWFTDPHDPDTDDGGVSDGDEVAFGGDPLDPYDDLPGDDAEESFSGVNPSQGGLGTWSYGYYEPGETYTQLPVFATNVAVKLESWQLTSTSGSVPRVVNNYHTANKTYTNVLYPAEDFLVVRPKNGKPVVVQFVADTAGEYRFDTTFRSARNTRPASTLVSVKQAGAVIDACSGSVTGLRTDVAGNELHCADVSLHLAEGETVDFVVDANGTDLYDEVALSVEVYESPDVDTDSDGLTDYLEDSTYFTDPNDDDTDDDGLTDGQEVLSFGTNPLVADTDGDGLIDGLELFISTDPNDTDTDDDGLGDGFEEITYHSAPQRADTDSDLLLDGEEFTAGTDPGDTDSDDDGLEDGEEVHTTLTNPLDSDSDNDNLSDGEEVDTYSTDPNDNDTDGDTIRDAVEVFQTFTDPTSSDPDGDGLSDPDELWYGTDPFGPDYDGDGVTDGEEVNVYDTNPWNPDTDEDGLDDHAELFTYLTDPWETDSDGGGESDGDEVTNGRDPTDPSDDIL